MALSSVVLNFVVDLMFSRCPDGVNVEKYCKLEMHGLKYTEVSHVSLFWMKLKHRVISGVV